MEPGDDSQDELLQTVRPVHKNNLFPTIYAPVVHVVINIEPDGKKIILWDDILQAFKDADHARHGSKILPFLKDSSYNQLRPLRFNAVPNAILDIVVDGQFTSTDPPPVQSTFQDIVDNSSQYAKYDPIDRLIASNYQTKVDIKEVFTKVIVNIDWDALEKKGEGTPEEFLKALQCYLRAIHQGQGHALLSVGELFAQGDGVEKNEVRSFEWYLQAAYKGNAIAQRKISRLIINQPSRSSAAPEAVQYDTAKREPEPAAIVVASIESQATLSKTLTGILVDVSTDELDTSAKAQESYVKREGSSNNSDNNVLVDLLSTESLISFSDSSSDNDDSYSYESTTTRLPHGTNSHSTNSHEAYNHIRGTSSTTTTKIPRAPQALLPEYFASGLINSFTLMPNFSSRLRAPQLDTDDIHQNLTNAGYGDPEAQVRIGDLYIEMNDKSHDEKAARWFFRAAVQGDSRGQRRIANMYMLGLGGLPKDYSVAMYWCLKAVKQGDVRAQHQEALFRSLDLGATSYNSKAVEWLLRQKD
ncbi:hypothetical protein EC991_010352 [Linnemannia zychae]|nr:hypothetical protein EC991_010352 [Linnemannia zychae]